LFAGQGTVHCASRNGNALVPLPSSMLKLKPTRM
jgi:hypothetical protein